MCTLVVATRVWQSTPLLVAANRDEALGRASEGPSLRLEGDIRVLAPRDEKAGGTWMGVNAHRLFVAVTNRFAGKPNPKARSRGKLVTDVLREKSPADAVKRLLTVEPTLHNPFHLLVASDEEAHLVWNSGKRHHHEPLAAGVHIITERSLGAGPTQRVPLIERRLKPIFGPRAPDWEAWAELLRAKADPSFEGVCVHDAVRNYGTRSSSIVTLGPDPTSHMYLHADGAPDRTPYVDHTSELAELLGVELPAAD